MTEAEQLQVLIHLRVIALRLHMVCQPHPDLKPWFKCPANHANDAARRMQASKRKEP